MNLKSVYLCAALACTLSAAEIEKRGASTWPTQNHFRVSVTTRIATGSPVLYTGAMPSGFNPDSVRVRVDGNNAELPAKVDWRVPTARISWLSTGAASYQIYFDTARAGETTRLTEPAMIGAGERVTYGLPNVRGRLAVGLWAHPTAIDFDGDGNTDLIVGCPDRPYNGIYLFRNLGTNDKPLYDKAEWLGTGKKDLVAADFSGDGKVDLVYSGGYFSDVQRNRLSVSVAVKLPRNYHIGRDDLWYPVDWDGDGLIDVLAGVSDWRDYGWDDAFNSKGEWTRGPLHGYIYFHRNIGTNAQPQYASPVVLKRRENPSINMAARFQIQSTGWDAACSI